MPNTLPAITAHPTLLSLKYKLHTLIRVTQVARFYILFNNIEMLELERLTVINRHYQRSIIFAVKARAYLSGTPYDANMDID
jgi:hypothetical protein